MCLTNGGTCFLKPSALPEHSALTSVAGTVSKQAPLHAGAWSALPARACTTPPSGDLCQKSTMNKVGHEAWEKDQAFPQRGWADTNH